MSLNSTISTRIFVVNKQKKKSGCRTTKKSTNCLVRKRTTKIVNVESLRGPLAHKLSVHSHLNYHKRRWALKEEMSTKEKRATKLMNNVRRAVSVPLQCICERKVHLRMVLQIKWRLDLQTKRLKVTCIINMTSVPGHLFLSCWPWVLRVQRRARYLLACLPPPHLRQFMIISIDLRYALKFTPRWSSLFEARKLSI